MAIAGAAALLATFKQQCLLLLLAVLCLALLQTDAVDVRPDPFCSTPEQPPPALYNTRGKRYPFQQAGGKLSRSSACMSCCSTSCSTQLAD